MEGVPCVESIAICTIPGTAYIGSNSNNVQLGGYYPGFIGCIQDVYFDYNLMIPEKTAENPELVKNIQVKKKKIWLNEHKL